MSLKLSYRDKVIFIVFICLIILVLGVVLIVRPKVDEMGVARQNLEDKEKALLELEQKIEKLDGLVKELIKTAEGVAEIQENFYVEADPYIMEQTVTEMLDPNENMDVTAIETKYAIADLIREYKVYPRNVLAYDMKMQADLYNELPQEVYDAYNKETPPPPPAVIIGVTEMEFNFEAPMSGLEGIGELLRCLDIIAEEEFTIIAPKFSGSSSYAVEEPTAEYSVTILMFSIVPLDVELVKEESDNMLKELGIELNA